VLAEVDIYKPKKGEIAGDYILHDEELHDFYSSPDIIWVIKSKRTR